MEKGKTYTENEMEDIKFLEEENKTIFYKYYISNSLIKKGIKIIDKWKKLLKN